MKFKIPLTDIKISIGDTPQGEQRGKTTGRSSYDISRDEIGIRMSKNSLFTAYRNSGDIFSCVREITETLGVGGHKFINPITMDEVSPLLQTTITDIIKYSYMDITQFKDVVMQQALVSGDVYIEKIKSLSGNIIGLKVLDTRSMAIVSDVHGRIFKYIQHSPFDANWENATLFEPEEIIHMKVGNDPDSEMFGLSPLEPVLWDVRADLSASVANYHLFENNAMPSGMVMLDENASDETLKQTVVLLRQQYKGAKNKGKLMASKNIKDIKPLRMTHIEMQYLDGRRFSTEKVCAAYGVPKSILGYTEGMTFNNQAGQMRKFYSSTVKKHESWFEQMVNVEIIEGCLKLESQMCMKFNEPMFDTEDILWERAVRGRETGVVTTNEAREIVGLDSIDEALHSNTGDMIVSGRGTNTRFLIDTGVDPDSSPDELDKIADEVKKLNAANVQ